MSTPRTVRLCAVCQKRLFSRGRFCGSACKTLANKPTACTSCGESLADVGPGSTLCAACRAKTCRTSLRWIPRAKVPVHGGDCGCRECQLFALMRADPAYIGADFEP